MTEPADSIVELMDFADDRGYFASTCTIQFGIASRSGSGELALLWDDLAGHVDIPAHVSPSFASLELATPERTTATDVRTITLKGYRPAITTKHRAVCDGKDWDIRSVLHGGEKAFTKLVAQEVR